MTTTTATINNSRQSRFSATTALLFSLAVLTAQPASAHIGPMPRIVGGQNATAGEYSFFVSWDTSCGATVIHDDLLLTAAHCNPVTSNSVTIGAFTRGETHEPGPVRSVARSIDYRILHPDYDAESWEMDMMLLKLHGPVPDWIPRIRLNTNNSIPADGDAVTVIGMGRLDEDSKLGFPDVLQEVNVTVTEYDTCNSEEMYRGFIDDPTMICAAVPEGGQDACFGDSGGPLLKEMEDGNWTQIGIVSFGVGCARANRPGVYSRVSMAHDWIQDMICQHSDSKPASCPPLTIYRAFDKLSAAPSTAPSTVPSSAPTQGVRARDFTKESGRNYKAKTRARSLPLEFP